MRSFSLHKRVLPLTITVMAILFVEKAVVLGREVVTKESGSTASTGSKVIGNNTTGTASALPAPSGAPSSTIPPPVVSPTELKLLEDLRKRRQALDDRARQLDQKEDLVQITERKLEAKLEELTALQTQLEQLEESRKKRDTANWTGLVKTYEAMKPRDAATIFDVLDINVLLEVLDRMNERKAAAILAAMMPERARLATQMLAQKRTHADMVDQRQTTSGDDRKTSHEHG